MRLFLAALGFLTILPVNAAVKEEETARSIAYFPLAGVLIGLVLVFSGKLFHFLGFGDLAASSFLVVSLVFLTGGLHLDGLADTFDGLYRRGPKERILEIMRDPHVGAMGAMGIACVLLAKIFLLFSLWPGLNNISLILMCMLGRFGMVFSLFVFPYAREEGKAGIFFGGMRKEFFYMALFSAVIFSFFAAGLPGITVAVFAAVFVFLTGKFIVSKIGGITGDTIGAVNELTEIFVLFCVFILRRVI